jgi:hypothetical protein
MMVKYVFRTKGVKNKISIVFQHSAIVVGLIVLVVFIVVAMEFVIILVANKMNALKKCIHFDIY